MDDIPEQVMSREGAFRSFTLDAAYVADQEDVIGSLEPGKWADFILIDRDHFEIPEREIWKPRVVETWLAGGKYMVPLLPSDNLTLA